MSHGRPVVRRLSRLQPLSECEGGRPSDTVGEGFRKTESKRGLDTHSVEGLCGENGRNSKEEKNKQVQTNRDLLQETVYQLFDDGCCKVGTSVFTSSVNTLQYVTYSPNKQTIRTEWSPALFPIMHSVLNNLAFSRHEMFSDPSTFLARGRKWYKIIHFQRSKIQ